MVLDDDDGPLRKAKRVDHVYRTPLPWRDPTDNRTECGKRIEPGMKVITRDELAARVRDMGAQRAALFTCWTCSDRARYSGTWEEVPLAVLEREIHRVGSHAYGSPPTGRRGEEYRRLVAELQAVAKLIATHRDEFDGYVSGVAATVSLADRRAERARKRS